MAQMRKRRTIVEDARKNQITRQDENNYNVCIEIHIVINAGDKFTHDDIGCRRDYIRRWPTNWHSGMSMLDVCLMLYDS